MRLLSSQILGRSCAMLFFNVTHQKTKTFRPISCPPDIWSDFTDKWGGKNPVLKTTDDNAAEATVLEHSYK